ncbi:hypothetical protein [Azorhizobium sp. AG788]|uniref:hypothetical protein n=1 Tax=Azorhizobium sp. AG788 TaxID=2183897 RepID=UPI003138A683
MRTHFGERGSYVPEFVMVDTQRLRARMEAAVDTLLALLDEMDGDPDLEECADLEREDCEGDQPA